MSAEGGIVIIRGVEYEITYENGVKCLTRYNEKHKMRVKLRFSGASQSNSITDVLSRQFINSKLHNTAETEA